MPDELIEPIAWASKGHIERYLKGRNTACWVYGSPTAPDNVPLYDLRAADEIERHRIASTAALKASAEALAEALEPFKRAADNLDARGSTKGDHEISHGMGIVTAGDLRRARQALAAYRNGGCSDD